MNKSGENSQELLDLATEWARDTPYLFEELVAFLAAARSALYVAQSLNVPPIDALTMTLGARPVPGTLGAMKELARLGCKCMGQET